MKNTASGKDTPEGKRLAQQKNSEADWQRWRPYRSQRQWGTSREDYAERVL